MVFLNQDPMKVNPWVKYISAGGFGDKFHVLTLEVRDPWAEVKCTLCRLQESPWPHFGELSEAFYCRPFIHKRNQSFNPGFWVGIKKRHLSDKVHEKTKEKLQKNCLSRSPGPTQKQIYFYRIFTQNILTNIYPLKTKIV